MKRRHALTLLASAPFYESCRSKKNIRTWSGLLFNSPVTLQYEHATDLSQKIETESLRLESLFSLYQTNSALSQLNAKGVLENPPLEFIDLLKRCAEFHQQSNGLFDPTIQTYWTWLRDELAKGHEPSEEKRTAKLATVDFTRVEISAESIKLNGTQLTLNAVAQGYITDQITKFIVSKGIQRALVNMGEYRAIGGPWPIAIRHPDEAGRSLDTFSLTDQALAVSSGSGHRLTATGKDNHILSPRTGTSPPAYTTVAVIANNATQADAWATICSLNPDDLKSGPPADVQVFFWAR